MWGIRRRECKASRIRINSIRGPHVKLLRTARKDPWTTKNNVCGPHVQRPTTVRIASVGHTKSMREPYEKHLKPHEKHPSVDPLLILRLLCDYVLIHLDAYSGECIDGTISMVQCGSIGCDSESPLQFLPNEKAIHQQIVMNLWQISQRKKSLHKAQNGVKQLERFFRER
ncbi:hypothetical protein CDAR_305671 [Caerostris darwini]|uniref:Uncharacterized protein n=1 Tax=Caerostris darwini TaxID=1538125 RepID=A0AAV4PBL8_9ARAC|nr:hypothetical protein CDAR_305671 [Caerostris darwini]